MAGLTWILSVLCVAGGLQPQSSASPVLRSALVVQAGQNVSLTCNVTSNIGITWYLLHSDQLMPLQTVSPSKVGGKDVVTYHTEDTSRFIKVGDLMGGTVGLEILEVEEKDAGLYFCIDRGAGAVRVNRGIHLAVGVEAESARRPCLSLGLCALPASLVLCVAIVVGLYLCSGKPAVCCCPSARSDRSLKVTQDESLLYSSLKHADKPRPSVRRGAGLVREDVTYSTVAVCKNPNASHVHR